MNQTLKIKKLCPDAVVPERKLESNGYDLHSLKAHRIGPGETHWISTGLAVAPPKHTYIRVAMRSGMSGKGLIAGAGVVDVNYRGELKVCVHNVNHYNPIDITPDKAFAQFVCEVCKMPEVEVVKELDETKRGDRGFGSTDLISAA